MKQGLEVKIDRFLHIKHTACNELFWPLVRNFKILMDDSPISGKSSEQMSPNFLKFWPKNAYFQTLCSETSDLR